MPGLLIILLYTIVIAWIALRTRGLGSKVAFFSAWPAVSGQTAFSYLGMVLSSALTLASMREQGGTMSFLHSVHRESACNPNHPS